MLFSLSMLYQTAVLHKKLEEMEVLEANVEKWKKKTFHESTGLFTRNNGCPKPLQGD